MPWVRIHDGALRNLKVAALSDAAFRLWIAGLAHAQEHLTDGEIRHEHLKMLTAKTTPKTVAELTTPVASNRAPLWEPTEHGYQIHDYGQWNDTRAVVLKKRDEKRTRIARWRAARDGPQDAHVDALRDASQMGATTSTTTPTPLKNLGVGARGVENGNGAGTHEPAEDVAAFLDGYRERYQRVTGGLLPLISSPKDFAIATELLQTWPLPRLLDMAELWMHRTDKDVAGKPKTLAWFKPMAPWADTRLREAGR